MNKGDLIIVMSEKTEMTKKDSETALNAILDSITDAIKSGENVSLVGFGVFGVKDRAARIGRNPKTKEEIEIPATRVPTFKAGKSLKETVAK